MSKFNLSHKIDHDGKIHHEEIKKLIEKGDEIFCSEDYGSDSFSSDRYFFAKEKWKKFKEFLGEIFK